MKPKHYPYSGKKRLPKIVSADKGKEKQCKPEKYF